jgi:hypothetical protein
LLPLAADRRCLSLFITIDRHLSTFETLRYPY